MQKIDIGRMAGGAGKRLEKEINASGKMLLKQYNAADWTYNNDVNGLSHSLKSYLVSANKFGGSYEFSITNVPSLQNEKKMSKMNVKQKQNYFQNLFNQLDQENIVLGEVIEGKGLDPRAKIQYLGKPLKKILIKDAYIEN